MADSALHHSSTEPGGGAPIPTLVGAALVVLTRDESLIESLEVIRPDHTLSVLADEADLSADLIGEAAGVALLDAAAVATPLGVLTERLRAQFPDLVLIVAGAQADQAAISGLVTNGTVYRFLHKPVSPQRVKLFVDAALRRHDVEHATTGTFRALAPSAPVPPRSLPLKPLVWGGAAAVIAAAAGLYLLHARTGTRPSPAPAATSAAAGIDALLARAEAALERHALLEPAGQNAAELLRAALQRDAGNARARAGVDRLCDRLLTDAEQALLASRIDEAQRLTDAARSFQPQLVRVTFLTAAIAKERAAQEAAHAAPAAGHGRPDSGTASGADKAAQPHAAASAAAAGRNPGESALRAARAALRAGQLDEVERYLRDASDAGANGSQLEPLQHELQSARVAAKANTLARLSGLFNARIGQGQLLAPQGDSARFYLDQLAAVDASHPSTVLARELLATRLLGEARAASGRSEWRHAQDLLGQARALGASAAEADPIAAGIASGAAGGSAAPSAASAPVAASALQRTHYVTPVYPEIAAALGRHGVVELEFTVRTDGSVGDLTVLHSEPAGTFDTAALQAVRRWQYRPVERAGRRIEQRARVRLVFTPQ